MEEKLLLEEIDEHVMIVSLNRKITNALDLTLITQLGDSIRNATQDPAIHGFVLTSANEKFFSIGLDIPQLFPLSKDEFMVFYRTFNRFCVDLYTLPMPTIAAITGHAVAGGCILALCCDNRYIAEGKKKMGLNELKLGVPVPYPADRILHQIVGFQEAQEIIDTGDFFLPETLLKIGLVDKILPGDQLRAKVIEKVKSTGACDRTAYSLSKQNRTELVAAQIMERLEEKEKRFVECWYADKTRKRLQAAMKKF